MAAPKVKGTRSSLFIGVTAIVSKGFDRGIIGSMVTVLGAF
jgi:hypothetical protein